MALTNNPSNVESVYRYFNAHNVGYNLLDAISRASAVTKVYSRMRDQKSAEQLAECVCKALDNACDLLLSDQHALLGDPAINWAAN